MGEWYLEKMWEGGRYLLRHRGCKYTKSAVDYGTVIYLDCDICNEKIPEHMLLQRKILNGER